jgi:polyisoprenoid-binding protein YceI
MQLKNILIVPAALIAMAANSQTYKADIAKSTLNWTAKKVTGEHHGHVKLKDGTFTVTNNRISGGEFNIDMSSISDSDLTDPNWNNKLITHLKSQDFFNVATYPVSTIKLTGGTLFQNDEATVYGTLTIKDISQPITFKVKKVGKEYAATITIDRTKYDIKYGSGKYFPDIGDKMIYDDFILDVKIVVL